MTKLQRDLLAGCYNRKIEPTYEAVEDYAARFKKYERCTSRDIKEVVYKLVNIK